MTNIRLCLGIGLIVSLMCNGLHADPTAESSSKIVKLGAEDSWPPYSDKEGKGISADIINAAFTKMGFVPQIQVRAYARVLQDVKSGVLDGGFNVSRQKSTEEDFIFGNEPLMKATAYWYFPRNTEVTSPRYKSLERLPEGTRVGGIIDYEYGDLYEAERHKFREVRVSRQAQLVKMLQQGRIDAAIMYEEEASHALQGMGLQEDAIKKGFLNHTSNSYVAFSRKNKNSVELAKALDEGLTLLKASGEYDVLLRRSHSPVSIH